MKVKLGKVIAGAVIGVAAVAAAPFTGGGSILAAGTTIAGSLAGAGIAATAAGATGAVVGAVVKKEHIAKAASAITPLVADLERRTSEKAAKIQQFQDEYETFTDEEIIDEADRIRDKSGESNNKRNHVLMNVAKEHRINISSQRDEVNEETKY